MNRHNDPYERTATQLRGVWLFNELSEAELRRLAACTEPKSYEVGSPVVQLGAPHNDLLYYVLEGYLKVTLVDIDGNQSCLNVLGPRSYIGELSWIDKQPRSATVTFIVSGKLLHIRSPEQGLPQSVAPKLAELTARRVRCLGERLHERASRKALHRVAKQFDQLADLVGASAEAKHVLIDFPVTQDDVGDMVMTTRETVNKCEKALRLEGLIVRESKHRIRILDRPRLRALAAVA